MVVVNKLDRLSDDERSNINNIFDKPLFISAKNNENIDKLKDELIKSLEQDEEDKPISRRFTSLWIKCSFSCTNRF